jgi:hypothetical protein
MRVPPSAQPDLRAAGIPGPHKRYFRPDTSTVPPAVPAAAHTSSARWKRASSPFGQIPPGRGPRPGPGATEHLSLTLGPSTGQCPDGPFSWPPAPTRIPVEQKLPPAAWHAFRGIGLGKTVIVSAGAPPGDRPAPGARRHQRPDPAPVPRRGHPALPGRRCRRSRRRRGPPSRSTPTPMTTPSSSHRTPGPAASPRLSSSAPPRDCCPPSAPPAYPPRRRYGACEPDAEPGPARPNCRDIPGCHTGAPLCPKAKPASPPPHSPAEITAQQRCTRTGVPRAWAHKCLLFQ